MNLLQKSILTCMVCCCALTLKAQQMPLYSQYGMYNPAVTGCDGFTTISLTARDEWIGFDDSPKTYVFSVAGRVLRSNYQVKKSNFFSNKRVAKRSGRIGLGATIFTDHNGLISRTGAQIMYAYHIYMNNKQLSFGLAASTFQFKIDQNKLEFRDQEPLLNSSFSNKVLVPDVTFGVHYLAMHSYYGFSVANLFQSQIKIGSEKNYDYRLYRHYFLMAGRSFNEDKTFSYEPSVILKGTEKMVWQADFQMRVYYNRDYYLGLTYRTGSAVGTMVGLKWDRFYFSYVFDYNLTPLQKHTFGSHVIILALKLVDSARRYRWLIRY